MRFKPIIKTAPAVLVVCALLMPSRTDAQPGRRGGMFRAHPAYGHVAVEMHRHRYFYHNGFFYRHGAGGYFVVDAPFGVVVPFLPFGAVRVHFGPDWFFYYGGVYYESVPEGYVVVKRPETVYVAPDSGAAGAPEKPFVEPKTKTVMIKNSNGSQTPVLLEEVDGKWKGPKGEFYDAFPTDAQLRSAYGF